MTVMLLAALSALVTPGGAGSTPTVRVRATEAVAPCVAAASRAFPRTSIRVEVEPGELAPGHGADVVAGVDVEVTRALEGGAAEPGTDRDVALIPWVLSMPAGNPEGLDGLADVARRGREVTVPSWPAAYEARRALRGLGVQRVREAHGSSLRRAPLALLPLSLAGEGERLVVDVRPLRARAALGSTAAPAPARAFLDFLASKGGQRAFSECGQRPEP